MNVEHYLEKFWVQLTIVCIVSIVPILVLLVRGLNWGADSFAYWSVSCGNNLNIAAIHSPSWFIYFIQEIINCNFGLMVFFQWVCYFLVLLSIWEIGRRYFSANSWRLPVYVGCLTPLFFIEAMRFEHEIYGLAFAFVAVALICVFLEKKSMFKWSLPCFALLLGVVSALLWTPSVFVLGIVPFLLPIRTKWLNLMLLIGIILFIIFGWGSFTSFFTWGYIVSEQLPLIGLIFVIHIIHFWKKIPLNLKWYSLFLIFLGLLQVKYMFLCTPFLLIGLLDKQIKEGISLKREVFGVKQIPVLYVCGVLLIGWFLMGISLYPTQSDIKEMHTAINLSHDLNVPLYNSWGDGWIFESIGYPTNYKISPPEPDWNKLTRPYIAYSDTNLTNCIQKDKRTFECV